MKKYFLLLIVLTSLCKLAFAQLNLQWHDLGPDNMGAPVRGLVIDKRDSTRQTLYAGVDGGGVWKTTDRGAYWNFLGCIGNYAVTCMAQAADGTIYFGTGDELGSIGYNNSDYHLGNGIYKIDDLDNVIHLDSSIGTSAIPSFTAIKRIAVNPQNAAQLISATSHGLYFTANSGVTWVQIQVSGVNANSEYYDVKWANDGLKIFANAGYQNIRSTDAGIHWQLLNDTLNPGYPAFRSGSSFAELAIAPSNSNDFFIEANSGGIYKSSNAGFSWDTVALYSQSFAPFNYSYIFYGRALAISPADTNKIYLGGSAMYVYSPQTGPLHLPDFICPADIQGQSMYQFAYAINDLNPDEMYVGADKGVFKSFDAVTNFSHTQFYDHNNGLTARDFISVAAAKNGSVMGGSQNAEGVLVGNLNDQHFVSLGNNLAFCEFSHLDTAVSFVEQAGGSALFESTNNLASFVSAFDTAIDPENQGYVTECTYATYYYFTPVLLHETKTAFNTCDSVNYVALNNLAAGATITGRSATAGVEFPYTLNTAVAAGNTIAIPDPVNSRVYLASGCGLWLKKHALTLSSKPDWFKIYDGYTQCIAVSNDGNTIYMTGESQGFRRITGLNTAHYTHSNMVDSFISTFTSSFLNSSMFIPQSIAVDPSNDSVLLVTVTIFSNLSNNLYKSTDAGKTWEGKHIGPANLSIYSAVIDAGNSNNYIVGTEHGIWTSSDSGATWQQENGDMCDVPVYQLRQIPLYDDGCPVLYAATNARGLWRSYSLTPSGCNISAGVKNVATYDNGFIIYPNPASSVCNVRLTVSAPEELKIELRDITGRLLLSQANYVLSGTNNLEINISALQAGSYLISLIEPHSIQTRLLVVER